MSETNTNNQNQQNNEQNQQNQQGGNQQNTPDIDYDKLAGIISGKQKADEETILKKYFKNQGLSADEMKQAIAAYKDQKAKNTPDVGQLQSDLTAAQSERLKAQIHLAATKAAIKQGVPVDSVEYLLRMADFANVTGEDGKVDDDALTESIKKVLEDVPALKGTQSGGGDGFNKIGGDGDDKNGDQGDGNDAIRRAMGLKPKNK